MTWKEVDKGWGDQARVWATVMEPRWWPEFDAVLRATNVGQDMDYLDIACGSGLMVNMASRRGARAHGLDASDRLLELAKRRTPTADIRHGDMNALPWSDGSFDVATSCRGIWGPNQEAVHEAARVIKPGGCLGLSFFRRAEKVARLVRHSMRYDVCQNTKLTGLNSWVQLGSKVALKKCAKRPA